MKTKGVIITAAALLAAGAGTAGILMNTRKAKMKRLAKRTGKAMYTAGTVLRTLSCQSSAE
jgi:2-keto-3-deoxy-6-phosphogluconate aldolase